VAIRSAKPPWSCRTGAAEWSPRCESASIKESRSHPSAVRRASTRLGALVAAALLVGVGLSSASAATTGGGVTKTTWRHQMQQLAVPARGCFAGSFPTVHWQQVQCHAAPMVPLAPNGIPRVSSSLGVRSEVGEALTPAVGPVGELVGDGNDYAAKVTSGSISTATGSFPYVAVDSTEWGRVGGSGPEIPNTFTLQLNTEFFSGSPACDGASDPSSCLAWQQFVYETDVDEVYMQYWLLNYGASCPLTWFSDDEGDCYKNSEAEPLLNGPVTISSLQTVSLTGTTDPGGNDSVVIEYGDNNVSAVGADSVLDLAGHWTDAEFDILGDGNRSEAIFSSGTTLDVKTTVDNGATTPPICEPEGFTGETNNLSFAGAPAMSQDSQPAIETDQTITAGESPGCAVAPDTLAVTSPGTQTSTAGDPVSLQVQATDSAVGQTLTWSATGLPTGLSISSSGVISGTPTTAGNSSATVTVADETGASDSSSFSWTVDAVAPDVPTQSTPTPGPGQATVNWSAPNFNGGSAITGYDVYAGASPGAESYASPVCVGASSASSCVVGSLANGTASYFTVEAVNAVGNSTPSNEASAVPATVPGAPTTVTAVAGNGQVTLTWRAPASDGGAPITSYGVTSSPGGITTTSATSPITFAGLRNGTRYTFTVTATNSVGASAASTPSNAVTPVAPSVSASSRLTVSKGRTSVPLTCHGATCSGTLKLVEVVRAKVKVGKKLVTKTTTMVLASHSFTLKKGASSSVVLTLDATGLKLTGRAAKAPMKLTLESTIRGTTNSTPVTLS
jgi:hypothetical protein